MVQQHDAHEVMKRRLNMNWEGREKVREKETQRAKPTQSVLGRER